MKKSLVLAMAMALGVTASAYAANPFSLSSLLHKKSRLPAAKKTGEYRVTTSDLSQPHG